jgi:hypothetical protein
VKGFERELMRRSPLAACVLELSAHVFDEATLDPIYEQNRGRCYEDKLTFNDFLTLTRDALIHHGGSAHRLFLDLEETQSHPVDESNYYRKLSNTPEKLSQALLRDGTAKLLKLMPGPVVTLAPCFDRFEVIVGDGKKVKKVPKRLEETRGYSGKLLGAKALVALDVRSGMAIAMSDSLDGQTNDVPLVPALMEQVRGAMQKPILSIWDRQFDDVKTLKKLSSGPGDAFLVRMKQNYTFIPESCVETTDAQGRRLLDEIGLMGKGKKAMRVRRITLFRQDDEDDVVLLTNLMDRALFVAEDLLELYRKRWGIEQVFQQVTETFSLSHLIGSSPKATLLQFAYCLLLYNMIQVIKAYIAEDGKVLASTVSTFYVFNDVRRELLAWAYHTDGSWPHTHRDAEAMRDRLRELLRGKWNPITYKKASDKKPRGKPKAKQRLHGGHTSVQRILDGRVKVVAS